MTAELQDTTQQIDESFFLGELIEAIHREERGSQPWKAEVLVNNSRVSFKLDSGADVMVIPLNVYQKLRNQSGELQPSNKVLMGPCRQQIDCVGKIRATLQSNEHIFNEDVYVVKNLEQPLLGCTAGASLKLISKVNYIESVKSPVDNNLSKQSKGAHTSDNEQAANSSAYKAKIVTEYPKPFKGLGETQGEYQIKLRDNAQPFALHVPRKVPLPLLGKTKAEIGRMLTMNIISRVDEPTDWSAPMVVTPKASEEVRICVDLTKLNQSILREAHPLPSVDFTLGKLGGSKVFSKIDANSAFWQRKLPDDSRLLTAFITPWGRFCFN